MPNLQVDQAEVAVDQAPPRCPRCAGALRPGAPWCTQCYLVLEGAGQLAQPARQPAGQAFPEVPAPVGAPLPAARPPRADAGWPCSACGQANPWEVTACTGCGLPFLAGLDSSVPRLALPGVGDLARLGRGQRTALAGAVLLLGVVLLLLLSVVGGVLLPGI